MKLTTTQHSRYWVIKRRNVESILASSRVCRVVMCGVHVVWRVEEYVDLRGVVPAPASLMKPRGIADPLRVRVLGERQGLEEGDGGG